MPQKGLIWTFEVGLGGMQLGPLFYFLLFSVPAPGPQPDSPHAPVFTDQGICVGWRWHLFMRLYRVNVDQMSVLTPFQPFPPKSSLFADIPQIGLWDTLLFGEPPFLGADWIVLKNSALV